MVSARVAGQPELERDLAAHAAHALDVLAGVVVVQLGGAGRAGARPRAGSRRGPWCARARPPRARRCSGRPARGRTARSRRARAARSPRRSPARPAAPRPSRPCRRRTPAARRPRTARPRPRRRTLPRTGPSARTPSGAERAERHGDHERQPSRGSAAADGRSARSRSRWPGSRRRASAARRARTSVCTSCSAGAVAPTTTIWPRSCSADASSQHVRERVRRDRAGRPAEVDQRAPSPPSACRTARRRRAGIVPSRVSSRA